MKFEEFLKSHDPEDAISATLNIKILNISFTERRGGALTLKITVSSEVDYLNDETFGYTCTASMSFLMFDMLDGTDMHYIKTHTISESKEALKETFIENFKSNLQKADLRSMIPQLGLPEKYEIVLSNDKIDRFFEATIRMMVVKLVMMGEYENDK